MSDDVPPETRSERLKARRRRYRWAGVLCAALVVGGAVTVAAFTMADDAGSGVTGDGEDRTTRTARPFASDELPELDAFVATTPPRALSNDDPLRVWVAGDSLAGALGPALGEIDGATGVVDTKVDYKISSGLAARVRDWPEYAAGALPAANPEVVVFMVGANDVTIVNSSDGDEDGVPDWEPDYRADVAEMMDLLLENERVVLWIGSPTMRNSDRDEGAVEVNRVMREEADKRAPDVVYVDAYRLFEGPDGGYSETIETANGDTIRARIDDGVHLTGDGANHLASAVFALLDARYDILAQADPENPLDYSIRNGGSSSSGSSSGSGRGGSNSGSRSSAPTIAPEVTEPAPTTITPAPPTTAATAPTTAPTVPPPAAPTTSAPAPTTTAAPADT